METIRRLSCVIQHGEHQAIAVPADNRPQHTLSTFGYQQQEKDAGLNWTPVDSTSSPLSLHCFSEVLLTWLQGRATLLWSSSPCQEPCTKLGDGFSSFVLTDRGRQGLNQILHAWGLSFMVRLFVYFLDPHEALMTANLPGVHKKYKT